MIPTTHINQIKGNQLNIIELRKADRLIRAGKVPDQPGYATTALAAWILYFEHWKEKSIMNQIAYPPVKEALKQLQALSADEETRRLADMRERALMAERTEIDAAEARGEARTKEHVLMRLIQSGMSEAQARAIIDM